MPEFSQEKRVEMMNQLREMMQEEKEPVSPAPSDTEEIPEDTPHYLNPRILRDQDTEEVYQAPGVSPGYHMVNGSGMLDSQRSGHDLAIHPENSKIKI